MDKDEEEKNMEESNKNEDLNDSYRDSGSEIYDDEDAEDDEKLEIEMEYDMLVSKIKDTDENQYFKSIMTKLYHNNPEEMRKLIEQLSEKQRDFMEKLLQTKKIDIEANGETKAIHRRIIKAKRRNQ